MSAAATAAPMIPPASTPPETRPDRADDDIDGAGDVWVTPAKPLVASDGALLATSEDVPMLLGNVLVISDSVLGVIPVVTAYTEPVGLFGSSDERMPLGDESLALVCCNDGDVVTGVDVKLADERAAPTTVKGLLPFVFVDGSLLLRADAALVVMALMAVFAVGIICAYCNQMYRVLR